MEAVVGEYRNDVFAPPVNTVAADKHFGGRRKLRKDNVGCLKGNMRQNVAVIDLNVNHRYVPKHKKQVQLDELAHFVTKEQAVIDLREKKQKTKSCSNNNNKENLLLQTFFLSTSCVPRDVKALQPEGQSGTGAANRHSEAQHHLRVPAGLSGLPDEQHRQGTTAGRPPLIKRCRL